LGISAGLQVLPFEQTYLEPAAEIFGRAYAAQRTLTPSLPPRYDDPSEVLPLIRGLTMKYPAVVALSRGKLVGYLSGMLLPSFRGSERGVYCPEWGHAACGESPGSVYDLMYSEISRAWVGEGCLNQALTVLTGDRPALDAWFWLGFGMIVVDAVRGLEAVEPASWTPDAGITVRLASPAEGSHLLSIKREHTRYYREGPIFLPKREPHDAAEVERELASPRLRLWVAEEDGQVIGIIKGALEAEEGCQVVRDPLTASITGAYVRPAWRRRGAGSLLLQAMLDWARDSGCARVSVDFESANLLGRSFWLKRFSPVCYSLFRHVDDRVLRPDR